MHYEKEPVKKILVISPHADDEVIGCGGMITLAGKAGIDVTVVVMATGGVKHCHLMEAAQTENRVAEFKMCAQRLGVSRTEMLFPGEDMNLVTIHSLELVSALDNVLNESDYDECYLPEPNYNKDHQITYKSAIAALRPGARRYPLLVATYESTTSGWLNKATAGGQLYVDITSTIKNKLFSLKAYQSQIRSFPHPTSSEAIKRLAAFRGIECGVEYAELFQIIRMVRI